MIDPDAINRQILAEPWNDLPRLVLADWLAENGAPRRSELIRVGCELASLTCKHRPSRQCKTCRPLRKRQTELAHHALRDWEYVVGRKHAGLGMLPSNLTLSIESRADYIPRVRRGFLEAVIVSGHQFHKIAADLFNGLPITRVEIADPGVRPEGGIEGTNWSVPRSWVLGSEITKYFNLFEWEDQYGGVYHYRTQKRALNDISQACVRWGRKLAGLPEEWMAPKPEPVEAT